MASTEVAIMSSVSNVITFIKERIKTDLNSANQQGLLNLSEGELLKIAAITESSIEASFGRSMNEVLSVAKQLTFKGWEVAGNKASYKLSLCFGNL